MKMKKEKTRMRGYELLPIYSWWFTSYRKEDRYVEANPSHHTADSIPSITISQHYIKFIIKIHVSRQRKPINLHNIEKRYSSYRLGSMILFKSLGLAHSSIRAMQKRESTHHYRDWWNGGDVHESVDWKSTADIKSFVFLPGEAAFQMHGWSNH